MPYFEGDLRIESVPERERDALFDEFMFEMEKQQREAARQARRENMRALRLRLEQMEPSITVATQWRKIKDQFRDDKVFQALDKADRLTVFEDYIRDLERLEEEKKREEAQRRRNLSRKNRDEFRVCLY